MDELTEESDDDDLAYGMLEKNPEAMRLVLRRHGPEILGWLTSRYRPTLQLEEIEDILDQAAAKVWINAGAFDSKKGSLGGWFLTIAQRTAQDFVKGRRRYRKRFGRAQEDADPPDPEAECPADDGMTPKELEQKYKPLYNLIETRLVGLQRKILLADLAAGSGEADNKWLAERFGTTVASIRVSRIKAITNLQKYKNELESLNERNRGKR